MSNESTPKRLTREDPVDPEMLAKLGELEQARNQIGGELLDVEQAKVRLLSAAHQLDQQRHRLFEKILMDRGLPPNAIAEIDAKTGKIIVHREGPVMPIQNGAPPPQAPAQAAVEPTS